MNMRMPKKKKAIMIMCMITVILITGCTSEEKIDNLNSQIEELNQTLNQKEAKIQNISNKKRSMEKKINKINNSNELELTPSLENVKEVVNQTNIEKNDFNYNSYICLDFAYDLVNELREEGIYSCATGLYHSVGAHSNVAVKTENKGIVFIEAQTDKIIYDLEEGDDYCEKVGWDCEWTLSHVKHCFNRSPENQTKNNNIPEYQENDSLGIVRDVDVNQLIKITSLN